MRTLFALFAGLFSSANLAARPGEKIGSSQTYTLIIGKAAAFELKSPKSKIAVVFEDDGETGYFYALDYSSPEQPIQEAMSVYDVRNVTDKAKPSIVRITWSSDGTKVGLWINNYAHAVFDFAGKRGYSRRNFPQPGKWKSHDFSWNEDALKFFQ